MEILILILVIVIIIFLAVKFKVPKMGAMSLITGGVKTGKTTLSVYLAIRKYKVHLLKWKFRTFIIKFFKKIRIKKFVEMTLPEKPLLYSNIPLNCEYVPVTRELLLRKERFSYGSVLYLCESSLIIDSMCIRDPSINEQLLLFCKLFGHETKGGIAIWDTQNWLDNHYAIKRTLSTYLYIHHGIKIPFFYLLYVREMFAGDGDNVTNVVSKDIEDSGLQLIIVPKSIWKKFDCYCYSTLTDDLPVNNRTCIPVSLKAEDIVSFKEYLSLKKQKKEVVDNEKICEKD